MDYYYAKKYNRIACVNSFDELYEKAKKKIFKELDDDIKRSKHYAETGNYHFNVEMEKTMCDPIDIEDGDKITFKGYFMYTTDHYHEIREDTKWEKITRQITFSRVGLM